MKSSTISLFATKEPTGELYLHTEYPKRYNSSWVSSGVIYTMNPIPPILQELCWYNEPVLINIQSKYLSEDTILKQSKHHSRVKRMIFRLIMTYLILIFKGILLYSTIISAILYMSSIESLIDNHIWCIATIIMLLLILSCKILINEDDMDILSLKTKNILKKYLSHK